MNAEYDVVQVGYGPVGQVMAGLLGRLGHRVAVFERHPSLYPLPRAGHAEDDVIRIFQAIGAAEEVLARTWPLKTYRVLDAARELLAMFDWDYVGPSGWHGHNQFYQPYLEASLDAAVRRNPNVDVHQGWIVESVENTGGGAVVSVRRPDRLADSVRARFVVGADGANSTVRTAAGIEREDLGFEESFLVLDVRPHDRDAIWDLHEASQICDITRPTTAIRRLGPDHARWEFMLLAGDDREALTAPEACWELLRPFGPTPESADLIRSIVYTFESKLAETYRSDRLLLIGDAAHLMPPFLGQGMCSGMRDAAALAWRLDLVLRGVAPDNLLDSYTPERRPHVRQLILDSMALGRIVCTLDPEVAAARDAALRSGTATPPEPTPGLSEGVLQRGADRHPIVGRHALQARVRAGAAEARLDDAVGGGWRLLPAPGASVVDIAVEPIGLRTVKYEDVTGAYARWFGELGVEAVLVRPDFYVFGVARRLADVSTLVEDLVEQLGVTARV